VGTGWELWVLLTASVAASVASLLLRTPRQILRLVSVGGAAWSLLAILISLQVFICGPVSTAFSWLRVDSLSAYQLVVLALVYGASSIFANGYFLHEESHGKFGLHAARRFAALWFGSAAAMSLVLLSNNLGLMWVGIEATTLLTGFLITIHSTPLSLEAMWKYLLVCSVGVAFAFVGTLLVGASAQKIGLESNEMLMWTSLSTAAPLLNPGLMKLAFIFLIVGYGTKAGLAPMHSWLPDAHSQAPAPVSALFSGAMLNTALYCIMRYLPLVEGATGYQGWGMQLLLIFGLISIMVAAGFIIFQHDGKRLLAYHSVEHMGIIALGLGLGPIGAFAALWHTLNHALCKSLSFFAIGRLGQAYGSHSLDRIAGAARRVPLWGMAFLFSIIILIGVAPFAIFMSEFAILRAAISQASYVALGIFLLGTGVVFISALKHALDSGYGKEVAEPSPVRTSGLDYAVVGVGLAMLLALGVWMPGPMRDILEGAARIIGGAR